MLLTGDSDLAGSRNNDRYGLSLGKVDQRLNNVNLGLDALVDV